jgi:hypothetical protein
MLYGERRVSTYHIKNKIETKMTCKEAQRRVEGGCATITSDDTSPRHLSLHPLEKVKHTR